MAVEVVSIPPTDLKRSVTAIQVPIKGSPANDAKAAGLAYSGKFWTSTSPCRHLLVVSGGR